MPTANPGSRRLPKEGPKEAALPGFTAALKCLVKVFCRICRVMDPLPLKLSVMRRLGTTSACGAVGFLSMALVEPAGTMVSAPSALRKYFRPEPFKSRQW
jgi:hypothetical protein